MSETHKDVSVVELEKKIDTLTEKIEALTENLEYVFSRLDEKLDNLATGGLGFGIEGDE